MKTKHNCLEVHVVLGNQLSTFNEDVVYSTAVDKVLHHVHWRKEAHVSCFTLLILRSIVIKVMIHTLDTDGVRSISNMDKFDADEIWIAFGIGRRYNDALCFCTVAPVHYPESRRCVSHDLHKAPGHLKTPHSVRVPLLNSSGGRALLPIPAVKIPSHSDWAQSVNRWCPVWTYLPEASKICHVSQSHPRMHSSVPFCW